MAWALERSLRLLKKGVKSLTAQPFWLRYGTLAPYRAFCAGASALTGLTRSGARHAEGTIDESVEYIASVFNMYKAASGLEKFHGRVAEIGPGDSCGVGLMFLADGCRQVDLVDRFFSARDERRQQAINRNLVERLPQLVSLTKNGSFSESSFPALTRYYGESAAAEFFFKDRNGYDCIVSCAVLEHAYNPLAALSAAGSALNAGGRMLHQVDCRDHGQFSENFHELKFLELSESMYAPLKWRGGPNRIRLSAYVNVLRQERMDFTIYINSLAGIADELPPCTVLENVARPLLDVSREYVAKVRAGLAMPFRSMPDEDLMITRFLIVASKAPSENRPDQSAAG